MGSTQKIISHLFLHDRNTKFLPSVLADSPLDWSWLIFFACSEDNVNKSIDHVVFPKREYQSTSCPCVQVNSHEESRSTNSSSNTSHSWLIFPSPLNMGREITSFLRMVGCSGILKSPHSEYSSIDSMVRVVSSPLDNPSRRSELCPRMNLPHFQIMKLVFFAQINENEWTCVDHNKTPNMQPCITAIHHR